MAKRSQRRLSKKGLVGLHKLREPVFDSAGKPKGSKLARDENGNIIWIYQGEKFTALRDIIIKHHIQLLGLSL